MGKRKTRQTTTQVDKPPSWVEGGARQAIDLGRRIGSQRYTPYTGERVAGLSENERRAMGLAGGGMGVAQPYIDKAGALIGRGTASWTDADQSKYINPYIKGALDPAARELREYGALQKRSIEDRASSMDAWGRRSQIAKADIDEKTLQGLEDLYGRGYADAYRFGAQLFGQERAREMEGAGRFAMLGGQAVNIRNQDISTLMTTGAVDRTVQQAMRDFDYGQFIENRDWDLRNLGGLISALQGTQGSYTRSRKTVSETEQKGGELAQAIGLAATLVGAFATGGASLAMGAGKAALGGLQGGITTAPMGGAGAVNVAPLSPSDIGWEG